MAKTVKKNGWKGLALFLAGVIVLGAAYSIGFGITGKVNPIDWTKKEPAELEPAATSDLVLTVSEHSDAAPLFLSVQSLSEDGVSGGNTITATVKSTSGDILNEPVAYSLAWAQASDELITDYVEMTTGGNSATFIGKKAFNTQIIVTCALFVDPSMTATATIDYAREVQTIDTIIKGVNHTAADNNINFDMNYFTTRSAMEGSSFFNNKDFKFYNGVEFAESGSINDMVEDVAVKVEYSQAFKNAANAKLGKSTFNAITTTLNSPNQLIQNGLCLKDMLGVSGLLLLTSYSDLNSGTTYGNYISAFYGLTNQIEVTVTLTMKYRGTKTFNYSVTVNLKNYVSGVELDNNGIVL